jgi:hypothetical protein
MRSQETPKQQQQQQQQQQQPTAWRSRQQQCWQQ